MKNIIGTVESILNLTKKMSDIVWNVGLSFTSIQESRMSLEYNHTKSKMTKNTSVFYYSWTLIQVVFKDYKNAQSIKHRLVSPF